MTFLSAFRPAISELARNRATLVFIGASLLVFLSLGTPPAALLVFAGGFNGLVLPVGLTLFLYVAWRRGDLMHDHRYPRWLLVSGAAVCAMTWYMAISPSAHLRLPDTRDLIEEPAHVSYRPEQ